MKLRNLLNAILILSCCSTLKSQTTLIDFGSSASNNSFQLAGWNTALISNNLDYSSEGNGGVVVSGEGDEYSDYRGVSGILRDFIVGERVIVTWFNSSDDVFYFTSRISFTDSDEPNGGTSEGNWYTMRSFEDYRQTFTEIQPHSFAQTVFNITDTGVHKTDESHSVVNINLAIEWGETYPKQFIVCDKIELFNDADIIAPSAPTNLSATVLEHYGAQLSWNQASDNVGVVEYLIYANGLVEGYSHENEFTCYYFDPETEYTLAVSALDAAGNESGLSESITITTNQFKNYPEVINPGGLQYVGAFSLPEEFSWGGEAIAYNQDGNGGQSSSDNPSGSLFITNLNQPENGLVGEVTIPHSMVTSNPDELNIANILQSPTNIRPQNINNWDYVDIWRTGLEYVSSEERLYSSWSIHYTVTGEKHASISCCDAPNLSTSTKFGPWYIGSPAEPPIDAMANDYLFSVPQTWADVNLSGRNLIVGRFRDGGLSGLGPTMYSFSKVASAPPAVDESLDFTTLLQYGSVEGTDNYYYPNSMNAYKHSDEWREAVCMNAGDQLGIAVVGNKAMGHNWYGYNGENMHHEWVTADVPYPDFYATDPDGKGWRSHRLQPMIVFYDPSDLASVANGLMESYEPQPYAAFRIPDNIFFGENHEIFSAAFDQVNSILYLTEFYREGDGRLIMHSFNINYVEPIVSIETANNLPHEFELLHNYPNPFNPSTTIDYNIPVVDVPSQPDRQAGGVEGPHITLRIFDTLGREVATIVNKAQSPGNYSVQWDASDYASGLYFYKLTFGEQKIIKKMLLMK